jgi:murein DD-endopeptidase MepM/ murein hydrolase activator NlpD
VRLLRGVGLSGIAAVVVGLFVVPMFVVIAFLGGGSASADSSCGIGGAAIDPASLPDKARSFDREQLANGAEIMRAAKALGLPAAAQVLGIQAALGESGLRVIDRGDSAGPDSRGLFQQRDNGAWGTYADRMNPFTSATNFYKALQKVAGWEHLEPSTAIHRVQRNAVENHYTQYRAQAVDVVRVLGGTAADDIRPGSACLGPGGAVIGELAGKWVHPLPGSVLTSGYGPRDAPEGTAGGVLAHFHYGVDFATPGAVGTVVAVTDMRIVLARNSDGQFGTRVVGQTIDGKLTIGFYHLADGSLKVKAGDVVGAGTPLGTEGATGNVAGRHLHLEFFPGAYDNPYVPEYPTANPEPILKSKGVL